MKKYWSGTNQSSPSDRIQYLRVIQSLLFLDYRPLPGISVDTCSELNETCGIDIDILKRELLPQTCTDFMDQVKFMGREIPCQEIFKLHHTEVGDCFTANSLFSNGKEFDNFKQLPLRYSNRENIERSFEIKYTTARLRAKTASAFKFYIHSPEELPNMNLKGNDLLFHYKDNRTFKTVETMNENGVRKESIEPGSAGSQASI